MTTKKIETVLPLFTGFYESMHSDKITNWIEYEMDNFQYDQKRTEKEIEKEQERLEKIDDKIDYQKVFSDYAEIYLGEFKNYFKTELKDFGILNITFDKLYQPRQYNFETDEIYCTFEINEKQYTKKAKELLDNPEVQKYIKEKFSSRSGFISFHSSESEKWKNDLLDQRKISVLTELYLRLENGEILEDYPHLDDSIYDEIEFYTTDYIED